MSVTVSNASGEGRPSSDTFGTRPVEIVKVAFDSSYPSGGEAFDPGDLRYGYGEPAIVIVTLDGETDTMYQVAYDYTNHKLIVAYGDNNNASDAVGVEVPNTTDLSDLAVRVLVIW